MDAADARALARFWAGAPSATPHEPAAGGRGSSGRTGLSLGGRYGLRHDQADTDRASVGELTMAVPDDRRTGRASGGQGLRPYDTDPAVSGRTPGSHRRPPTTVRETPAAPRRGQPTADFLPEHGGLVWVFSRMRPVRPVDVRCGAGVRLPVPAEAVRVQPVRAAPPVWRDTGGGSSKARRADTPTVDRATTRSETVSPRNAGRTPSRSTSGPATRYPSGPAA
jgi:hypothetical protein